jgi:predicted outer membrane protein
MADTTVDDVKGLMGHAKDELKDLTDKAKGADWDKNFMDKMIEDHQKVLDKLQSAAKDNTDPEITKALTDATGHVQEHLTKAQAIRAKLP